MRGHWYRVLGREDTTKWARIIEWRFEGIFFIVLTPDGRTVATPFSSGDHFIEITTTEGDPNDNVRLR